jgi:Methyltransferase domain
MTAVVKKRTPALWSRQIILVLVLCISSGVWLLISSACFGSSNSNRSSYALARSQSFGYFDDITDAQWQRHQERARNEPLYSNPHPSVGNNNVTLAGSALWLLENVDPLFTCPNVRRVGGRGDGPKWTCDPHRLLQQPHCLVYSIGSFGAYSFEDGLVQLLGQHCEIHVFDPSPDFGRGDDEHPAIHYHPWGLKYSRQLDPGLVDGRDKGRLFYSLPQMMEQLGHTGRTIHVLKLDCERCEIWSHWDILHPSLDIRQILIETHFGLEVNVVAFFNRFLHYGYVPFSKEANTHPDVGKTGIVYEWGFLKLDTKFLGPARPNLTRLPSPFHAS